MNVSQYHPSRHIPGKGKYPASVGPLSATFLVRGNLALWPKWASDATDHLGPKHLLKCDSQV